MSDITHKTFDAEVRAYGERSMCFCISTEGVDRDNDTIRASGWKLASYRKNPVVLWAHDHKQLPVARCTDVRVEGDKLVAVAEFPGREIYEFGATVFDLLKNGFLRATSVGFKPLKCVTNHQRGGTDYEEQELVEFSIVNVPSNPMALATRGADSAAFKSWLSGARPDEVVLDLDDVRRDDGIVLELLDPLPDRHARHHAPVVFEGDRGEARGGHPGDGARAAAERAGANHRARDHDSSGPRSRARRLAAGSTTTTDTRGERPCPISSVGAPRRTRRAFSGSIAASRSRCASSRRR